MQLLSYHKAVFPQNEAEMPLFLLPFQSAVRESETAAIGSRKTERLE